MKDFQFLSQDKAFFEKIRDLCIDSIDDLVLQANYDAWKDDFLKKYPDKKPETEIDLVSNAIGKHRLVIEGLLEMLLITRVSFVNMEHKFNTEIDSINKKIKLLENKEKVDNSYVYAINFILKTCENRWDADRKTIEREIVGHLENNVKLDTIKAAAKLSNSTESLRRNILLINRL